MADKKQEFQEPEITSYERDELAAESVFTGGSCNPV
jgi:hypothetical protein